MTNQPVCGTDTRLPVAFLEALMQPLPDAELNDPELKRLEAAAARQAKKKAEDVWHHGFLRTQIADFEYKAASYKRLHAALTKVSADLRGAYIAAEGLACAAYFAEIKRQMETPAALARHVSWKREHARLRPEEALKAQWQAIIEAEEARLGIKRKSK